MGVGRREWLAQRLRPSDAARRREAKRRSEYFCRMDVSALAAVLCGLLFAFLAATPQPHTAVSVGLAKSRHFRRLPGALREDALRVVVTRDGRFYLGNQGIGPEELPAWIRNGINGGAENRVYIVADARVKYGDVKMVLDQIRAAGMENVSFLTLPAPSRRLGSEPVPPELSQPKGPLHWSNPGPLLMPRKFSLAFPRTPDVL
jgi:biopolymer transport protein TolR